MNQDDIIRWTREAGGFDVTPAFLTRFAALVAAHEREEILWFLSGIDQTETDAPGGWWETSTGAKFGARILEAIRTRGQA